MENLEGRLSFRQIVIHIPVQLVAGVEIPVSSVATERGFSFHNKIKMVMRSRLSERKTQNLTTIASAASTLDALDYRQVSHSLNPQEPGGGLEFRPQQLSSVKFSSFFVSGLFMI